MNGSGWLIIPGVNNGLLGSIAVSESTGLPMSRAASELATVSQTDVSASSFPGQIRLPNPNTYSRGSGGVDVPRKRSGLKALGSGYIAESRENSLRGLCQLLIATVDRDGKLSGRERTICSA